MFLTEEEEKQALNDLQRSIRNFNRNYNVTADIEVFSNASEKNEANQIFINTFKDLLRQSVQDNTAGRVINIISMRAAFEREVVSPYRKFAAEKAKDEDVENVKRTLPDVEGGLSADEWCRELNKSLDNMYWEKIDRVSDNYKKGSPRIRDMVAEAKRVLSSKEAMSPNDVKRIASYAAALKRTHDTRSRFWNFIFFVRSNAELREYANIERMLNERLGVNAYKNAFKELTDPNGKIERLREQTAGNRGVKIDFSVATPVKNTVKKEEKNNPSAKEEKIKISVEEKANTQKVDEENKVSGNDELYRLLGDKSFEAKIKDDIWNALKLKETISLDKKTTVDNIFKPLLESAKRLNEEHFNLVKSEAKLKDIETNAEENATSMFTETYLKLESFNLAPEARVVAAQKIANTMLNNLTVIGFEKGSLGKFGDSYAVNTGDSVLEILQFGTKPLSEEASEYVLSAAKKQLTASEKARVSVVDEDGSRKVAAIANKYESKPVRDSFLSK